VKSPCVTVTGTVYSKTTTGGTFDDPDVDLQFTLTLDKQYEGYSKNNLPCTWHTGLPNPCYNIIVEVICHTTPRQDYKTKWGDYCNLANPEYPHGQFPSQGDRLSVSGRLVEDTDQNHWREIHPAFDIHKVP
jgi:hypothetical protein